MNRSSGFVVALLRELKHYHGRSELMLSVAVLLASMMVVVWTFASGTLRDLPIAVIDQDNSSVSRLYIRMLDAAPEMRIRMQLATPNQARELLEQGTVYAAVLIPRDFAKNLKTGRQATVIGWHSGQFLTISGALSKSLVQVTASLSAGIEMTTLAGRGDSTLAAQVHFEPVQSELRTLFNPLQNYQYFLVSALLPSMLQVFVMVWGVLAVGREFRAHSAGEWLSAGHTIYAAVAAKMLPVFVVASVIGLGCLAWVHGYSGWPVAGSLVMLILGWEIMIAAYLVLGLLTVSLVPQLATALSITAAFTAPAFAYAGITYPQQAMPVLAQIWAYALPIRTLLRLQVEQAQMGAPVINSLPELIILLGFVVLPLPWALKKIRLRCEHPTTQNPPQAPQYG